MPPAAATAADEDIEAIRAVDRGRRLARSGRRRGPRRTQSAAAPAGATRGAADHAGGAPVLGVSPSGARHRRRARVARRWGANPIDAFLLVAAAREGADAVAARRPPHADPPRLSRCARPAADAGRSRGLRRTIASPDAWPKLVDRLLASPHYGERWARHWLDLVRYADSGGFEFDVDRPRGLALSRLRRQGVQQRQAVRSQFVREQIAGDEYAPAIRRGDDRDRVPAARPGRRRRRRARAAGRARRHRRDDDADVHGPDGRVRALPQPQVRSDPAEGLLPDPGGLLLDAAGRASAGARARGRRRIGRRRRASRRCCKPLQQAKTELEAPYLKQLVDARDRAAARVPADRLAHAGRASAPKGSG